MKDFEREKRETCWTDENISDKDNKHNKKYWFEI